MSVHNAEITTVINITLLAIQNAEPDRVTMCSGFIRRPNDWCNTPACVGGWTCLANVPHNDPFWRLVTDQDQEAVERKATQLLTGYNHDQSGGYEFSQHMFMMAGENFEAMARLHTRLGMPYIRKTPMVAFDNLPDHIRKAAAINVLTKYRDTGMVKWLEAVDEAITTYLASQLGGGAA